MQAIERAMRELRLGAPPAVDRATLYETFADELTEQLRQVHAGWCLNAAQGQWRQEGPVAVPDEADARQAAQAVTAFVDTGLGGLERAVLQMEIGAGRDTRTSRAALRLGPREYDRHRTEGLSKLRSVINGLTGGRVCENHREAVMLAATGDAAALRSLSSGPDRCRTCAREAAGMRRVLQERLALAPWPLAIKPAGLVAAKFGVFGALFGGKGGGAASLTAAATGPFSTGGVLAILATAAVATGTATMLDDDPVPTTRVVVPAAPVVTTPVTTPRERSGAAAKKAKAKAKRRSDATKPATSKQAPATQGGAAATTTTPATETAKTDPPASSKPTVEDTVGGTVDEVRKAVEPVTTAVPPQVQQPVDQTLDQVQDTLDDVTGAVDDLLP